MQLFRDLEALEGTCYFEFLPGQYKGECWKAGSLFISEEDFSFFEPAFEAAISGFDRYAFVEPTRDEWEQAISNLTHLKEALDACASNAGADSLPHLSEEARKKLSCNWPQSRDEFASLVGDLVSWLHQQLQSHVTVSILGL